MPYLLIPLLQITCIIHALRSGRDRTWVYILVFLPGVGVLAYLVVEILPGLWHSRTGRGLQQRAIRSLDPSREVRRRREALEEADTVDNHRLLAEALVAAGEFNEAVEIYRRILTGIHADDPGMLLGMAEAAFAAGQFDEALRTVLRLGETNPRYQPVAAQLLYARTLEALRRDDDAAREYEQLVTHAPARKFAAAMRCCCNAAAGRWKLWACSRKSCPARNVHRVTIAARSANGSISPAAKPPGRLRMCPLLWFAAGARRLVARLARDRRPAPGATARPNAACRSGTGAPPRPATPAAGTRTSGNAVPTRLASACAIAASRWSPASPTASGFWTNCPAVGCLSRPPGNPPAR